MKSHKTIVAIGLLLLCSSVSAESVDWIFCFPSPPTSVTINPSNPDSTDTITFSVPIDNNPSNACQARAAFGGTPMLDHRYHEPLNTIVFSTPGTHNMYLGIYARLRPGG